MKVLIISHNPISSYQNMGKTMLSLFSGFDKNELCQFYIYPNQPDVEKCASYFRITDKDILNSFFHFGRIASIRFDSINDSVISKNLDEKNSHQRKKTCLKLLFRDLAWSFSRWFNHNFCSWINEMKPSMIFLAPGESKFIYDIALKIQKKFNIPLFVYICDEFYFVKKPRRFLDRVYLKLLRKKIEKTISCCSGIVCICDRLTEIYSNRFNKPAITIMTGSSFPIAAKVNIKKRLRGITYLGNIANNRFNSIVDVGKALDSINEKHGTNYKLLIYTKTLTDEQAERMSTVRSLTYCGYVIGDQFDKVLHESDVLLHIEAFDSNSIDKVKHSISTKLADYLGTGIPLLAYGPSEIESMRYLNTNKAAFVATSYDELSDVLNAILGSVSDRILVANNALKIANDNHVSEKNSKKLRGFFETNVNNYIH